MDARPVILVAALCLASTFRFRVEAGVAIQPITSVSAGGSPPSTLGNPTVTQNDEDDCQEQIGTIENGVPKNKMRKYDVEKILEELGGAPGKLNITWKRDVPEAPVKDPKEYPLPDTDNATFWLYNYMKSDIKTYYRAEHALIRNKGTSNEYVDIRGEVYWTPPDFCGKMRHAKYRVDDKGFSADVSLDYCWIGDGSLSCASPGVCTVTETYVKCVAAPISAALIAALVG